MMDLLVYCLVKSLTDLFVSIFRSPTLTSIFKPLILCSVDVLLYFFKLFFPEFLHKLDKIVFLFSSFTFSSPCYSNRRLEIFNSVSKETLDIPWDARDGYRLGLLSNSELVAQTNRLNIERQDCESRGHDDHMSSEHISENSLLIPETQDSLIPRIRNQNSLHESSYRSSTV